MADTLDSVEVKDVRRKRRRTRDNVDIATVGRIRHRAETGLEGVGSRQVNGAEPSLESTRRKGRVKAFRGHVSVRD